jgi:pimeloyl-ACP methyl ester carboxylesterase
MTMSHLPDESLTLNEETRAALTGSFIALPQGVTHYELGGPPEGRSVVLLHGFSVPMYLWDPTFEALVGAGFHVLRYDLFGRGTSDRPPLKNNVDLFDRQLEALLDALAIASPVSLVGVSMGAIIAASFADRHSERVDRLALIDPAGFPLNWGLPFRLMALPLLGELMMPLFGARMLVSGLPGDLFWPEGYPQYVDRFYPQLAYRGFRRSILSTLRYMPLDDHKAVYRRVGAQGRPILLVWGEQDGTVPFEYHRAALEAMPQAEFHAVREAGHIPHYERPEVVSPLLIEFLQGR